MSQLNVYVPDQIEKQIRKKAKKLGKSISGFLTDILTKQVSPQNEWQKGFFTDVVGGWAGELSPPVRELPQDYDPL